GVPLHASAGRRRALQRNRNGAAARDRETVRGGRRHPARRLRAAAYPLSGRHRDRAADRAAVHFRSLRRRAASAPRARRAKPEHIYIDACAAALVRRPWDFDVLVTENMFGDILSDLAAGLIGGMGMAPSADIGDTHAVFQPCHGTAPDIMGTGKANPAAMVLSTAMMLDWLAERHEHPAAARAALRIEQAVDRAFAAGLKPCEMGGRDGTAAIARAVMAALE